MSTASRATNGRGKHRDEDDLWRSAYGRIKRDPDSKKLLTKFNKVVREELQENGDLLGHLGSTEGRQQLLKFINAKAGNLSTGSGPFNRVIQVVLKTKDIISAGAVASPPAAVAVAGLFVALSMGQNYLRENKAMADCTEVIAWIICRRAVEDSQLRSASPLESPELKDLRDRLRFHYLDLYSKLLTVIARLVVKLDSGLRRWADNVFGLTDWVEQRRTLDEAERECERDLDAIHRYKSDPSSQPLPFEGKGRNRLHWNAKLGNAGLVAQLVQDNAFDVNARTVNGRTALSFAAEEGHLKCCKNILPVRTLEKNARTNRGQTALHLAARKDHVDVVKLLIDNGLGINIKDNDGRTALHVAALLGRTKTVKWLCSSQGITLDTQDSEGRTALHLTADKEKIPVITALAEKGCKVDVKDNTGRTAFLGAAHAGNTDVVRTLLTHGADVNQVSEAHRWSALHMCAAGGHLNCLKALLDSPLIDIDAQTVDGHTPLHEAVRNTQVAVVKELCARGAKVDVRNKSKRTAFLDAAKKGRLNVVKTLKESGANIDQVTGKNRWSALHEAVFRDKVAVARYLVEQGVQKDLEVKGGTQKGLTARQMAEARGNAALLEIL